MVTPAALSSDSNRSSVTVTLHGPITAGTIPNENNVFTTCVDPVSAPKFNPAYSHWSMFAEAPGTAPGSALLIPHHVYRHVPKLARSDNRQMQGNKSFLPLSVIFQGG